MREQMHGGMPQDEPVQLDFSVNINPLGMPGYVKEALREAIDSGDGLWEAYPDPMCGEMRKLLARCHHVPAERILCGNGASELIMAAVRAFQSRKETGPLSCVLPVPSFLEYERALLAVGARIVYHRMREEEHFTLTKSLLEKLTPETDLLFLCNPNNPTGSLLSETFLQVILEQCKNNGIAVILDECFWELAQPSASGVRRAGCFDRYPDLVVLKAFTKLYAMPGLRIGYCICPDAVLAGRIEAQLPCWNVSGIGQMAGLTVLKNGTNADYISQSREIIERERSYLERELQKLGMKVLPGQANFLCFYSEQPVYERLLEKGILIRDCSNFKGLGTGWYRIAVRKHEENVQLMEQMKEAGRPSERRQEGREAK